MATSFSFSTDQLAEISRLRTNLALVENSAKPSGAVALYSFVFKCVTGLEVPDPVPGDFLSQGFVSGHMAALPEDQRKSAIWLYGAIQVNSNNGAFSDVIRAYNVRQGELRGMGTFTEEILQRASNAVGLNLASSILDETLPGDGLPNLGQGTLPDVQEIGTYDLLGVRDTLYPGNEAVGSKLHLNQAWPGIVMLGSLGGKYTDRLLRYDEQKEPVALNLLSDFENLLLCWDAFQYAFQKTLGRFADVSAMSDVLISMNLAPALIAQAITAHVLNGSNSLAQFVFSALIQNQNAEARTALNLIADLGSAKFLDMLMGATIGQNLTGRTTEANFASTVRTFFNAYGSTLQTIGAHLLPINAAELAALAQSDTAEGASTRAALGALSVVRVDVSAAIGVAIP